MVFTGPAPLDDKVVAFGVTKSAQLAAERSGGSVIVSTSRRTPAWLLAAVEGELEAPTVHRWTRDAADNPAADSSYATLIQGSAAIFVTGDSASIVNALVAELPLRVVAMSTELVLYPKVEAPNGARF